MRTTKTGTAIDHFALDGFGPVVKMIQYAYNSPNSDPGCAGLHPAARQQLPGYVLSISPAGQKKEIQLEKGDK
jgi:hypothetical protein